jgi:thiosulfate reductase/polysulfide reductase chain A
MPGIRGALCTRGTAGIAAVNDEERPQFPMLRKGERGQGHWQRLSWEQALAHAAEKLDKVRASHGGQSILWSDTGGPFSDLRQALVRGLGSPNFFGSDAVHGLNRQHAALSLFGFGDDRLVLDLKNARQVVLQGRNLFESVHIQQANDLLDSLENGGRLTVIDVRATVTSGKADRFWQIRPGTDYAVNLAVIHTLLKHKLYQADFAQRWIADLDELWRMVADYPPEFAQAQSGIPAADIVSLTEDLAKAAPRVIWHPGWRTSRYSDSFFVCRTAFIINTLLGAIGAPGGLPLAARPEDIGQKGLNRFIDLFPPVTEKRADGVVWAYPLFAGGPGLLHEALRTAHSADPYVIKAYVTYQHDPLSELPDPQKLKEIFANLDFLMSINASWSQTAWHADLILPLSPYLERESILGQCDGLKPTLMLRRRGAEPRYETRADWEIVAGLARELGLKPLCFGTSEDLWQYQLKGTRVRLSDFDAQGLVELTGRTQYDQMPPEFRFPTDSGKVEMVNFRWRQHGLPSLGPYSPRTTAQNGVFRLTMGGCGQHADGHTINNPMLHKQMPENVLWMNQAVATRMGISNGSEVVVSIQGRSGRIRIKLTEHIHPEAVFLVPGFGRTLPVESRACNRGLAANSLMAGGLELWDPAGGGLALQEHWVTVNKV